jgi:hypothetical protein
MISKKRLFARLLALASGCSESLATSCPVDSKIGRRTVADITADTVEFPHSDESYMFSKSPCKDVRKALERGKPDSAKPHITLVRSSQILNVES